MELPRKAMEFARGSGLVSFATIHSRELRDITLPISIENFLY